MAEHLIDIKVLQPGRPTGQYFSPDSESFRLEKIIYPEATLPFDVCILPTATSPEPPKKLPPLTDTASSGPEAVTQLNEQFSAALAESLAPDEQVHSWALLLAWFDRKKGPEVLVATERRLFLLSNHPFEIGLSQIATLEYASSILESWLAINYIQKGAPHRRVIYFHHPAQDSFRDCYEAARRCLAVIPAV